MGDPLSKSMDDVYVLGCMCNFLDTQPYSAELSVFHKITHSLLNATSYIVRQTPKNVSFASFKPSSFL